MKSLLLITGKSKYFSTNSEVLNFDVNKVCQIPPYPKWIVAASGAIINSKLIICGGALPTSTSTACFSLEPMGHTWQNTGNLLRPRGGAAAIETNGKLFVTGGWNEKDQILQSTELFDESTMQSTFGPDLPVKIAMHCMVKLNSSMAMIIGGMENSISSGTSHYTSRTYFYSATDQTFTMGPKLLYGRSHASCGVLKGEKSSDIVVAGGWNGKSILKSTEYLTLDNLGSWKLGKWL